MSKRRMAPNGEDVNVPAVSDYARKWLATQFTTIPVAGFKVGDRVRLLHAIDDDTVHLRRGARGTVKCIDMERQAVVLDVTWDHMSVPYVMARGFRDLLMPGPADKRDIRRMTSWAVEPTDVKMVTE